MDDGQYKADKWMSGWVTGAADGAVPKPMRTDPYFQAGYVEGQAARKAAAQRVEGHYGFKPGK